MTRDDEVLDPRWPAIEAELRRQPRVDPAAVDRVMSAVRTLGMEEADARGALGIADGGARRGRSWFTSRTIAISQLQAAAAVLILAVGTVWGARQWAASEAERLAASAEVNAPRATAAGAELASAAGGGPTVLQADSKGARPVQFVFVSGEARSVTLVGSFNDWNVEATPLQLTRDGMWSVVVPLAPGRHVYSFVVDGKQWVPDSAAPSAPADELGITNSIVYVGQGT